MRSDGILETQAQSSAWTGLHARGRTRHGLPGSALYVASLATPPCLLPA